MLTTVVLIVTMLAVGCASVESDDATEASTTTVTSDTTVETAEEPADGVEAQVDRVIDGDSLELVIDGDVVEVRLLGINAPELYTLADAESCNGVAARDHLRELVAGASSVRFVAGENDRFGRVLGVLVLDGRAVTELLVEEGWALALWSGESPALTELMMEAATAGAGMWGDRCGVPPTADLAIVDWQMDPPGDDRENLGDEWVAVANNGAAPVDLDGWMIRDETTSNRFRIAGYTLGPGDELRFRSGRGTSGGGDYYLDSEFPVWSNRGESVLLTDPEGRIAAYAFAAP